MRTLQRFGVGVALVLVALGGAGLASAGDEEVTLQLVARGGRFVPERLVAPAGKIVRIEIANEGTSAIEFESGSLHKEKVLAPGGRSVIVIRTKSPGEYPFFDDFHPDTGKGVLVLQ